MIIQYWRFYYFFYLLTIRCYPPSKRCVSFHFSIQMWIINHLNALHINYYTRLYFALKILLLVNKSRNYSHLKLGANLKEMLRFGFIVNSYKIIVMKYNIIHAHTYTHKHTHLYICVYVCGMYLYMYIYNIQFMFHGSVFTYL